ncbi:MAG: nickel pincer cofactor biosynthesis protein LarC [Desulfosarcina sp.]|nr:nickel pincer cofactor biosynthesis protein LarC [Desulfosarcina sp.]MBC2744249.1 nickel pincer cofactor biosynthesis protein LarC [Desulfosarcina sp.]MBC2767158.1 nickel pincer cofactor biosynthesis protein LarC [Desulfosarcina sp.]
MMHAHFDCFSGISGDMVLGAFVDLGVSTHWLVEKIRGLSLGDVEIVAQDVKKSGIGAKRIIVLEKEASPARNYRDIVNILENGSLCDKVKNVAVDVFSRIADAEARIHRCEKDDVHFHEVGAVDSIVDIVGAALCLDYFNIESVSSSPLPLGSGFVDCAHGKLPVPAPATLEIVKGLPVYGGTSDGELVTPTGAGIIASLSQGFGPIPDMEIERVGYGSGSRERRDGPNLLRVFVGKKIGQTTELGNDDVYMVETNIDDMNPEILGYLMEKLFQDGALDVCFAPVMMKKNRPGTKVEVLCPPEKQADITKCLFTETSTIGVRYHLVHRHTLKRSMLAVATCFGEIQVKCTTDPDGRKRYAPEYEACKKIALENNVPLKIVYDAVANTVHDGFSHGKTDRCDKLDS